MDAATAETTPACEGGSDGVGAGDFAAGGGEGREGDIAEEYFGEGGADGWLSLVFWLWLIDDIIFYCIYLPTESM